ncbi:GNAT family N-acetyltransferase [Mesorhizobium soli]|uniref:GNAT family N-acetyltransferase n=2 Tax=Pseudaminobacter soli (ex Li et al. 2025) TaxID=1295366 RepID=A0A2P7SNZ1_9HYPH|nr:GNAT family N-acetyltransferase [Mesorhizobium soli]PSJ64210.1 GNAT family N-acetyltransferase [Mesorhizobium soli]
MSNLGIRAYAGASDRDRLLEIWLTASQVGHPFLGEADLSAQMQLVRDTYLPQAENWVAVVEGQPAGFIGLLDSFIGGLFIDPAFHGCGIGKSLVLHAAQLKGALDVEVYADNRDACVFYRRIGFAETARHARDDEGRPLAIVRMHRP